MTRTAIEALHSELIEARIVRDAKAEQRAEAFRAMHAARAVVQAANDAEKKAAQEIVDSYVKALDMLGVAADEPEPPAPAHEETEPAPTDLENGS